MLILIQKGCVRCPQYANILDFVLERCFSYAYTTAVNHQINYTKGGYCCEVTSFYCFGKGHYMIFIVYAGILGYILHLGRVLYILNTLLQPTSCTAYTQAF